MSPFNFNLADRLVVSCSGETGDVLSRSESTTSEPQYLLRYKAADGRTVEAWWTQSALAYPVDGPAPITVQMVSGETMVFGDKPTTRTSAPPPIGHPWQGGIYAGVARGDGGAPDHHLILSPDLPDRRLQFTAAVDWAQALRTAGLSDWSLPNRRESSLLFANLRDQFEPAWYWTSEAVDSSDDPDGSYAWRQGFIDGSQDSSGHKSYEGRARAVRRFILQSFSA